MHFWIDKRSQQCGFGRSRVAASLSHAGSGLNYGHPPRRTKSTSCSNSTGQSMPPVHRSLPQTPYDMHQPGTSRQSQLSYGNNNSLHAQQQQHSSSGGTSNNNNLTATGTTTTASNNNHASGIASSAAVLTGSGTIVPLVARGSHYNHHGNTRYQPRTQQQLLHQQQQQQPHQHQQQQHQQQQHYSYHHPQFGNMAVPMRHYDAHQQQQQQQQYSGNVYADDAYSAYHHTAHHQHSSNHSTSGSNNQRQATAYATPRRHNSSSNMRHLTPAAAATSSTTTETASVASPTAAVAAAPATMHSNQLQQHHHALLQHADSQLLPSHLKCGMCASLVLASVFVAGTKFYFDHQGTGLEVLIFCTFSALFLAACLISLCRIPKGLFSSSSRSNGRAAVCHSRGVNSSLAGTGAAQSAGCLLEMSEGRYLEERQVTTVGGTAATAGPPPYHIAILLPEQTPATMGKQLPLDESPPPSYDKILV